ncbi:uncharacterized protein P884DRAFT_22069 [Thermothelomyces heterothallicus CBS 202.75]|uniref:uncharacterized protein n=1 Tax=Thermothelomyces heterothallicus CBS 202.75 TaxID=1149848 RepID=UPI003742EC3C
MGLPQYNTSNLIVFAFPTGLLGCLVMRTRNPSPCKWGSSMPGRGKLKCKQGSVVPGRPARVAGGFRVPRSRFTLYSYVLDLVLVGLLPWGTLRSS